MSKHTKGPWICYADDGLTEYNNFPSIQNRHGVRPIRGIDPENDAEIEEVHANAFLIAASPEMYDALDAIASACALQSVSPLHAEEVFKMIGRTAATALAKAKGGERELRLQND
jgi:hypothetical protein